MDCTGITAARHGQPPIALGLPPALGSWKSPIPRPRRARAGGSTGAQPAEALAIDPLERTVANWLEALLEHVLAHNPNDPVLNRLAAEMAFGRGEYEEAIARFRKTEELSRESGEIRERIAASQLALGRYQQVVDGLEGNREHPAASGRSDYLLGQAYTQLGNYTRAKACFEAGIEANPRAVQTAYALGQVYLRLKQPRRATRRGRRSVDHHHRGIDARIAR